jgi:gliding motility-associated-like protein
MSVKFTSIFIFCLLSLRYGTAQSCTMLGQTPSTAFPVCGTSSFIQKTVPNCVNGSILVNCPANGNSYQDLNPFWYKFTCFKSGTLVFTIKPNNSGDDYDWQLFDITGNNINDVYTADPNIANAIFVACNWSGVYGNTGTSLSPVYNSLIECGSFNVPFGTAPTSPPPFSKAPIIIQGHDYLMMISHFLGSSQSGYSLNFAGGSASITDTLPPRLKSATVSCDGKSIVIKLNKRMQCNSLASDGSDFQLLTGISSILSASGSNCSNSFDMDTVILSLDRTLPSGNYTIVIKKGRDGNTILDNCNNPIPEEDSLLFTVIQAAPTPMDSLTAVSCSPSSLQLVFAKPIQCNSIAPDGSDFVITGSFPVNITGAIGNCVNGLSTTIQVQFGSPIVQAGTFQINLVKGPDGNTIIDECNQETPASSLGFITKDTVSAAFGYQVLLGCQTDTINFTQSGGNGINSWNWNINGNEVSTLADPSLDFSGFGIKNVRLTVSNGYCSDSASSVISLDNELKASFGSPSVVCPEDKAVFTDSSEGKIISWNWNFGDGITDLQQNPSPHEYPQEIGSKIYSVSLIVQNSAGCADTATRQIERLNTCYIAVPNAFTPNGDGVNDYLYPLNAYKADNLEFKVFNRYGQLVFETRDWTRKWDGTVGGIPQSTGTYAWMLQYTDHDTGKKFFLKGTSVLIR